MRSLSKLQFFLFAFIASKAYSFGAISEQIKSLCEDCQSKAEYQTGAYILEYGEESLISRAWLTDNASRSIDVQYFIWSTDNIGVLASEALLRAAERGVQVRVIVDDLLIDADEMALLALELHPNVEIKIYNPLHSVGVSGVARAKNLLTDFHGANQRMHDKTAIFDGVVGITGGRNMADEYFDFNQEYNFRDRDILLYGKAVVQISENFEEFWQSELAVSVSQLLAPAVKKLSVETIATYRQSLHNYANNPDNFEPSVRQAVANIPTFFPYLIDKLVWSEARFISDVPGKNDGQEFLGGGSDTSEFLFAQVAQAKTSVLIQSPYLIMPEGGIVLLKNLVGSGVRVRINTNSLASTDNLMAFSGYYKQRDELLDAGVEIYEFKPHPQIQSDLIARYPALENKRPIFALHAKSMVIDNKKLYIGTFNLDPRSANLNTEVGVWIENTELAAQLTKSIETDAAPENSWRINDDFNPDGEVSLIKRIKLFWYAIVPMNKLL